MIEETPEKQTVLDFVERYNKIGVESTGAQVVNFSGGLYNVDGSTYDPKGVPGNPGVTWRQLLINFGINHNCYVTNTPAGGSHPDFSVGGHMTTSSNGYVQPGGTCYLMPLCYWHNSTSKNGILFTHTQTSMLQLTGYDQAELAATFQLRLPSGEPFALLYYSEGGWNSQNLSEKQAMNLRSEILPQINSEQDVEHVLFERAHEAQTMLYIKEVNLKS
jgi:hypothetical protein